MYQKVILIGRLGQDVETKHLPSGDSVANFTLCTSKKFKGRDGVNIEETEWHNIVAFRKTADLCSQYLSKGKMAMVEGQIKSRSWETKDGNKAYKTEIICNEVKFLSDKSASATSKEETSGQQTTFDSDSIPF